MRFTPVPAKTDFPAAERDLLRWWEQEGILARYLQRNTGASKRWSFLDGPITANNPMGVHHAWGRTYKDLFQRYHTMLGERQRYQNGFDGQGLWVEVEVERELGFKTKRDIEAYGIAEFVQRCKERVERFSAVQAQQSLRLGYWMDWDHSYRTWSDENNYTIWHFLKKCWERGLIYKGHDVMPWCPRCATGISEHEIVTEGYREITHPGLFVRLKLLGWPAGRTDPLASERYLVVWTTTPWTLTSNVAVAVNPSINYVLFRPAGTNEDHILAEGEHRYFRKGKIVGSISGHDLLGLPYRGPFDELPAQQGIKHRIIPWDEVAALEGTGLVHIAPGAGAEDFALSKEHALQVVAPLDEYGVFVDGFGWLSGRSVGEVATLIEEDLERKGLFWGSKPHPHRYPVCWRCQTELVFRLVDEWFIAMGPIREDIMAVTRRIRWIPDFGLDRELDWLRNMHDWLISKKRYWGLALPIYECAACGHFEVLGSKAELRERAVEGWEEFEGRSPHRPWIDAVKIRCSTCGVTTSRIADVGNPWLDAGIVSFSTLTDPATGEVSYLGDQRYWREWYPADFITEAFPGQYRNWFYSLLVMSTVLENREPFRVCLGHASVRGEDGREMHKSWGNAIDFDEGADRIGADVMRWLYATQSPALNVNFGYGPADEVRRRFLIPLWNVYSFFVTYANLERVDVAAMVRSSTPPGLLDRWILSRLARTVAAARERLDDFDPAGAARPFESFVDDLSNWYVRRSRRRFWKSEDDADKRAAYATLYEVLTTLARALAPFLPFAAETIYRNLVRTVDAAAPASVHLTDYPEAEPVRVDPALDDLVAGARRLVSIGRAARNKVKIRTRQPLAEVVAVTRAQSLPQQEELLEHVREELNVKRVRFVSDAGPYVRYEVKPRFDRLGPKYGKEVQAIARTLSGMDPAGVMKALGTRGGVAVQIGEEPGSDLVVLTPEEVEVRMHTEAGFAAEGMAGEFAILDTQVTPALEREGQARELVHHVQQLRKEEGLDLADRIVLFVEGDGLEEVLREYGEYVLRETLGTELRREVPPILTPRAVPLDGAAARIAVQKANSRGDS